MIVRCLLSFAKNTYLTKGLSLKIKGMNAQSNYFHDSWNTWAAKINIWTVQILSSKCFQKIYLVSDWLEDNILLHVQVVSNDWI